MTLKDWFASRRQTNAVKGATYKRDIPDGLWVKCANCEEALFSKELSSNLQVCPKCDFHFRLGVQERIAQLADAGSFQALDEHLRSTDPLGFQDSRRYTDRLKDAYAKEGPGEGVITGLARLDGVPIALGVMNFYFLGGSMGSVVGEKITRLIERAAADKLPLVIVTASGASAATASSTALRASSRPWP